MANPFKKGKKKAVSGAKEFNPRKESKLKGKALKLVKKY